MGYFAVDNRKYFAHKAKKGSMNSTTSERGSDGKPNNSSKYNHEYYMKNKDKWGVKYSEQTEGDNDFDDANFTDENRLGDTDFYGIKGADGSWTVIEENMKWKLPAGVSKNDIISAVSAVSKQDKTSRMSAKDFERAVSGALENMPGKSGKSFDVDAAASDVIRGKYKNGAERKAALGDDYDAIQKRVNEMLKAKHSDEDGEVIEHHGILGQKWGVRRFQNKDGTLTPAGRKHYDEDSDDAQNGSPKRQIDKSTLAKGAAIAGAVALGAVLITNPGARNIVAKYGKTAMTSLGSAAGKGAAKFVNKAESRIDKVTDAAFDAALLSVGGIAISKVTEKLAVGEDASEAEKNKSKVMTDVATAAIKTATGAGSSNNSGNGNKGGSVGKEVSDKIGAPSKKSIDKQSAEWQALFKDANGNQRDADTRATIKSLASAGYDIDQIDKYLNHAEFEDWASQYFAVEIGE